VHDIALKAAETDATKRALATFGRPFGLELYRGGKATASQKPLPAPASSASQSTGAIGTHATTLVPAGHADPASGAAIDRGAEGPRVGFHPDDTTPIPRPSRYYGRRQNELAEHFRGERRQAERAMGTPTSTAMRASPSPSAPPLAPAALPDPLPGRIDKSLLAIPEPKRLRDKGHLRFVASQPCLVCGRQPSDPHHLRFAQPRAIGLKVSDEFTVPLCRGHHRQLHQVGNEVTWWERLKIKPLEIARGLWEQTHLKVQVRPKAQALPNSAEETDGAGTAPDDTSTAPIEANGKTNPIVPVDPQ